MLLAAPAVTTNLASSTSKMILDLKGQTTRPESTSSVLTSAEFFLLPSEATDKTALFDVTKVAKSLLISPNHLVSVTFQTRGLNFIFVITLFCEQRSKYAGFWWSRIVSLDLVCFFALLLVLVWSWWQAQMCLNVSTTDKFALKVRACDSRVWVAQVGSTTTCWVVLLYF